MLYKNEEKTIPDIIFNIILKRTIKTLLGKRPNRNHSPKTEINPHPKHGTVIHIIDGDTLVIKDNQNKTSLVRLQGIDCPEKGQHGHEEAKNLLKKIALNKNIEIINTRQDKYGRTTATVLTLPNKINPAKILVKEGYAHICLAEAPQEFLQLQLQAQIEKRGIWNKPQPHPRSYRKSNQKLQDTINR